MTLPALVKKCKNWLVSRWPENGCWLMKQGRRFKICLIQPQKKLPLWVGEHKMEVGSRLLSVGCYQKRLSSKLQRIVSSDASSVFFCCVSPFVLRTVADTLAALHRAFLPNIRVWSCFCAAATKLTRHMQMQICRDGVFRRSSPCQRIHLPRRENFLEVSSLSVECRWQTSHLPNNLSLSAHFHALLTLNSEATQKHYTTILLLLFLFLRSNSVSKRISIIRWTQQNVSCYFLEVGVNYPSNSQGWEEALSVRNFF